MTFPKFEYYKLEQLATKWDICVSHIQHYVETGKITSVCWLDDCIVEFGKLKKTPTGYQSFEPYSLSRFNGFVGIDRNNARCVFKKESIVQPYFYSIEEETYILRLIEKQEYLLNEDGLYILRKEVEYFEDRFLSHKSITQNSSSLSGMKKDPQDQFFQSDNYQTVRMDSQTFRFGEVQSKIIKTLHEASASENPWVHGKILLNNAGSRSERLKSVFRSNPYWHLCIESDGRGYYRLKL